MPAAPDLLAARWRARSGGAPTIVDPTPGALANRLTGGREMQAPHLDLIDEAFAAIDRGEIDRLMVLMPPRRGKSRRVSRWGMLWWLARHPDRRGVLASYGSSLAEEHGRWIRDTITGTPDLGIRLRSGSRAADHFDFAGHDGGLVAVGVGGGLTGKGADLLVVDDPVRDREEADSETMRRKVWEWWTDVATTRLHPGAAIVLVMTRWHEDDLGGRILAQERDQWHVLSLPELAESEDDLLGREIGQPLWPARYSLDDDLRTRSAIGGRAWNALYQQRPSPPEGAVFLRGWYQHIRPAVFGPLSMTAISVDPATTDAATSDETGIIALGRGAGEHSDDVLVLEDCSLRATPAGWGEAACSAAIRRRARAFVVEKNQGGQMCGFVLRAAWAKLESQGRTAGMAMPAVIFVQARQGKMLRAEPVAALYEGARVFHAPGLSQLEEQMAAWVGSGDSPDRMDALVHGVSWLLKLGGRVATRGRMGDRRLAAR